MYKGKSRKKEGKSVRQEDYTPDLDRTLGMSQFAFDHLNLGKADERVLWFY